MEPYHGVAVGIGVLFRHRHRDITFSAFTMLRLFHLLRFLSKAGNRRDRAGARHRGVRYVLGIEMKAYHLAIRSPPPMMATIDAFQNRFMYSSYGVMAANGRSARLAGILVPKKYDCIIAVFSIGVVTCVSHDNRSEGILAQISAGNSMTRRKHDHGDLVTNGEL